MVAELCDYLVLPRDPRRLRWPDHASLTQHRQEPLQCRAVDRVDRVLRSPIAEIPLDHVLIDVCHPRAAACNPLHEVADQAEAPQTAFFSDPLFSKTHRIALDKLSAGCVFEPTECPAPAQVLFCNHHLSSAVESGSR